MTKWLNKYLASQTGLSDLRGLVYPYQLQVEEFLHWIYDICWYEAEALNLDQGWSSNILL
jgi:hypothetical protein